ncbi:MAG: anti-sigma factor family protein [Cyanobacteriota bacterium]
MDSTQRDRFELLSAYLDGEVTASERKQVQHWLDNDPKTKQLYGRLLKLRHGIHYMPVPNQESPSQDLPEQVFRRINQRRRQKAALWGGGAIAALLVGAVSGILPVNRSFVPNMAQSSGGDAGSETLMVALNSPAIEIPKAPIAEDMSFPSSTVNTLNSEQGEF